MKRVIYLIFVFGLINSVVNAQQQQNDISEEIIAKEKEMYEALKSGDMETFESNLADDFISVFNRGIVEKEQELERLVALKISEYELSDVRVIQPARDVAIISYALSGSGTYNEEEFDGNYYSSSTWIKSNDGSWKAALHTETEATMHEDPMGRE